jgi:hypothetical protein
MARHCIKLKLNDPTRSPQYGDTIWWGFTSDSPVVPAAHGGAHSRVAAHTPMSNSWHKWALILTELDATRRAGKDNFQGGFLTGANGVRVQVHTRGWTRIGAESAAMHDWDEGTRTLPGTTAPLHRAIRVVTNAPQYAASARTRGSLSLSTAPLRR